MKKVAVINCLNAIITIINLSNVLVSAYSLLEQNKEMSASYVAEKLFAFNIVALSATVLVLSMNSIFFLANARKAHRENKLSDIAKSFFFPLIGIGRTISGNEPYTKSLCLLSALSSINFGMLLIFIHQFSLWINIFEVGDISPTMFYSYTKEFTYIIYILGILIFLNVISLKLERRKLHRQNTSRKPINTNTINRNI